MIEWTKDKIDFIKKNREILSDKEISNFLNVNIHSLRVLRYKLRIMKNKGEIRKRLLREGKIKPPVNSKESLEALKSWNARNKGKSYEDRFGKKIADNLRRKSSERMKKNNPTKNGLSKNWKKKIGEFGEYHHNLPKNKAKDKERLKTYERYGYKTLIIWSKELKNEEKILNKIIKFIEE